jgi:hypothetical protein
LGGSRQGKAKQFNCKVLSYYSLIERIEIEEEKL